MATTIWFDTADLNFIQKHNDRILTEGVTTNPSILSQNTRPALEIIEGLLQLHPGWVAVQVTTADAADMVLQAQTLASLSNRIIVKIPANLAGLEAMQRLQELEIPVLATTILNTAQVILSAMAGATYAAFYLKHIPNYEQEIRKMLAAIQAFDLDIQLMGAAMDRVEQMQLCVGLGVPTATLPSDILLSYIEVNETTPTKFGGLRRAEDALLVQPYLSGSKADLVERLYAELAATETEVEKYLTSFATTWQNGPHQHSKLFALPMDV